MKINRLAVVSIPNLALALLVSLAGLPAGAAVFDDFESYAVGSNLHGQGGWSGWAGDPGAGAVVSTTFSFSPTRAVSVTGATDLVHTFSDVTNGQWVFKVMQYIPSASSGTNYVVLLNSYHPPFGATELNWSVQIQNNMNTGQIIADLGAGATRPMVKNQWVEIRVEINLASNTVTEFYNGQPLSTHAWQDGSGLNQLQALDLFANDSGPVYYDNVSLAPAEAPGTLLQLAFTTPSSFNESNRQAVLEWSGEPGKTYLVQSTDELTPGAEWKTEEPVTAAQVGPVRWMAPESIRDRKFYRLVLPRPEIFSVEPTFVDSSDPTALFYIFGQCLPTNGTIVINGQNYTPTSVDPNGNWVAISLNGLPPGTPVIGSILVLDNASNIVATLPVQTPVFYGTEMTMEQLQSPPDEPPASPECSWTKGGGASVGRAEWTKGGGASVGRAESWTKGGGASVGRSEEWTRGGGASVGRSASWTKGGGASVGKANPGKLFASGDGDDDDDGDSLDDSGFNTLLMPALMKAKEKANRTKCGSNLRVMPGTGEVQIDETDLAIAGRGLDFVWTRTYRSRTGPTTAQGAGWDFSYNVSLAQQPDGTIILHPGNGRSDTFYPNGTNGWARDEYFVAIRDLNSDGMPDVLFADTGRWLFNPLGTPAGGKLWQIIDRNGNTMTLDYNLKGQLSTIVDDLGRTNIVTYNPAGQIASITDSDGRILRYEHDGNGDLTACISPPVIGTPNGNDFPGGKTNRYTYTSGNLDDRLNHNLASCTDGKGQTWLTVVYQATNNPASLDFDAVASILRGVDKKDIHRGMVIAKPGYVTRVLQAIINDGVGNVTECFYDSRFRPVEVREFTGRANPTLLTTATENRPTGKLRAEDPDYFETRLEWNPDSLCTRVVYPRGDSTEMVYERAFNQNSARSNRAHGGDLRIVRELACCDQDDDGDGLLDALTTTFEYDPRFGSPSTGGKGKIVCNYVKRDRGAAMGSIGLPIGNGVAIKTKGTGADANRFANGPRQTMSIDAEATSSDKFAQVRGFKVEINGFVTSSTDPRGIVTTGTYDTNGNRTKVDKRSYSAGHFAIELDGAASYNSGGQLTAITNAADGNGYRRVDTFTYYGSGPSTGYLQSQTCDVTGLALTTSYEYDARGNVTRVVDPRGNDWLATYNQLDQCVRRQTPNSSFGTLIRNGADFSYDANDNLVRVDVENRDADGILGTNAFWRTGFTYDALDRVTGCCRDKNGNLVLRCTEVQYDANDNVVLFRDGEAVNGNDSNAVVQCRYDERNLPFLCVAAPGTGLGATNQWDYDGNGNCQRASKIDSFSIKQSVKKLYDGLNRLVSVTDPMSNVVTYAYDRNGNLIYERCDGELNDAAGDTGNRRLSETRYEHDALDRCVRWRPSFFDVFTELPIGDGEATSSCTYAPIGECLSITDDNGHVTRYTYDTAGRLSSITDPKTNVVSFTYDECDNVLSATRTDRSDLTPGAQQFTVVHAYDKLHRLTRSVDNVGNTNLYAYDSRDNLVRETDPRGNDTFYRYDGLDRCVDVVGYVGPCDASGNGITINTSHVEYDDNSRCVAATDSNSNTTHYAYDSLDRCVSTTGADGTSCSLIWSPRSNLLREQDANGTVISNRFDLLDRCVRRDIIPGSGVAATTTFETFAYDGLSQLVAATNDASVCTFAYDSLGNCVRGVSGGLGALTTTHDGVGNRLSLTYPSGRLVTYTYNALDEVASVSSGSGGLPPTTLATFDYEGPGRVGRVSRANNVNTRIQWNGLVNPPNATGDFGWGQIKGINHQIAGGGAVIDQRRATYDQKQNKTLRAQTTPFYQGGDTTTNVFEYDPLDRLSRAINTKGTGATVRLYALDGVGNRQVVLSNGIAEPYVMDATIPPGDFQMNQYTMTPFGAQSYDENGNLIVRAGASGPTFYQYDYADRLVEVAALNGGGMIGPVASFTYDALGRRISKTTYPPLPLAPVTTLFVYDNGDEDCDDIIEEHENGTLRRTYTFPHVLETKGRIMFTDLGQTLYFHEDDLGNVLALTDVGGKVVERYDYADYGAPSFLGVDGFPIPGANTSPVGNPYLFHGMEWDSETGFYHDGSANPGMVLYRAKAGKTGATKDSRRYADPSTGRGITRCEDGSCAFGDNNPWSQHSVNGINNNGMPNRISMNVTVGKQTQGATFGEKVNQGLHAAGGALAGKLIVPVAMDKGLRFGGGGGGGGGGSKAQDHNSSRSNKTASMFDFGGGGGGGSSTKQLLYSAKAGKTGSASGK